MEKISAWTRTQDFPQVTPPPHLRDENGGFLLGNPYVQEIDMRQWNRPLREAPNLLTSRSLIPIGTVREDFTRSVQRARLEFRWLVDNRQQFSGRWVALEGDTLLAVGDSAQDVYATLADHKGTPLVTRVDPAEEIPFAGW